MPKTLYADFSNPESGWPTVSVRSFVHFAKEEVGDSWSDTQLLSLTKLGVIDRDIDSGVGKYPASFEGYQRVEPDDIVFCLFDVEETPRTVGLVRQEGMITAAYTRALLDKKKVDPRYVEYFFIALDDDKRFRPFYNGLRNTIQKPTLLATRISLPPLAEQRRIAEYLDQELAETDALIAKQEQLITALDERRGAFINDGITGKLTEGNQRKPTGIPWLGDIPENWVVKRFRHIASDTIGLTYSPEDLTEEGAGTLVLRAGNVHRGRLIHKDDAFVSGTVPSHLLCRANDIVVCARSGSRSLVGKCGMVTEEFVGASFGAFMTVVRSQINDYLFWVLNSHLFLAQLGAFETSTINQLTSATLRGFPVPLPPEAERNRIVNLLNEGTDQIDALTARAQRAVHLLTERRQALISAAVTGKLEVSV